MPPTCSNKHQSCVLTGYDRIELSQIGEDAADVAEQELERIDEMDRGLVNEKALHGLEIGLAVEISAGALPVPRPQPERCLVDVAQYLSVEPALDLAIPGLETKIVVHDELNAGALGFRHRRLRLRQRLAERFLTDGIDPALRRQPDQRQMRRRRADDVDQIGPLGVKHRRGVGVDARYPEPLGEAFRLAAVGITDGGERSPLGPRPGVMMKLAEIAGPDGGDA